MIILRRLLHIYVHDILKLQGIFTLCLIQGSYIYLIFWEGFHIIIFILYSYLKGKVVYIDSPHTLYRQ